MNRLISISIRIVTAETKNMPLVMSISRAIDRPTPSISWTVQRSMTLAMIIAGTRENSPKSVI